MSGRAQGTGVQAERVLKLFRALVATTDPLWLAELAHEHGVTERTLRRDLSVVLRVVRATHQVDVRGRGVRLVARKAGR